MTRRLALIGLVGLASCSHTTDGPTPTLDSVSPDTICIAQGPGTIHLTGSGFSPVVDGALTDKPTVVMPRVFVGTTEVPSDGVSAPDTTGTHLDVILPEALVQPGTYDLRVLNPDGHDVTLAQALTIVPPPHIASVDPTSGQVGTTVTVTLTGTGFQTGMTITLDATPAVAGTNVMVPSATTASADFDLTNVTPGVYGITVVCPTGCQDTLPNAFTVVQPHNITVSTIDPPFGWNQVDTTVTITSADGGFVSTPRVSMKLHDGTGPTIDFTHVAFVDANTLTAVVPMGAPVSTTLYDVTVRNPPSDGGVGVLANGFRVVSHAVPEIDSIVPARGSSQSNTAVKIFGANFRDPVKVELLDRNLAPAATVASVTPVNGGEIDTTLPTTGMVEDAYLVRVTDLDDQTYSTFSDFVVGETGPSGNLHVPVASSPMVTGRRMLAGTVARDDLGNTYLYAIGGDTGATGTALATWERSQLAKFGQLGAWTDDGGANPLPHPLRGAAAVAVPVFDPAGSPFIPVKSYVYVSGGDDGGNVRGDVERAEVLRAADAPVITSIGGSATAGTLAAGTWYYKVSAVLQGGGSGDPDNPGGETLGSDEAILTISGATGAIDLSWGAVTVNGIAAASYNVYRTDAADGASQQEHLIATVNGTSYTDTGAAAGTAPPLAPGSLGVWVPQTQSLFEARWGHQMALLTDPATGARRIYVLGGKSDNAAGYLGTVEVATVDDQGHLSSTFGETGTVAMAARAFFSLAVETADNVSGFTGLARLFTLGGVNAAGASTRIEYSDVAALGSNAGWTLYGVVGSLGSRAGVMAAIAGDKLWAMGGAGAATDTTFSNIDPTGRDVPFVNGDPQTPAQSAANSLLAPRALGVCLQGAGFLYFVGGTSDGSNAVSTTEQTF